MGSCCDRLCACGGVPWLVPAQCVCVCALCLICCKGSKDTGPLSMCRTQSHQTHLIKHRLSITGKGRNARSCTAQHACTSLQGLHKNTPPSAAAQFGLDGVSQERNAPKTPKTELLYTNPCITIVMSTTATTPAHKPILLHTPQLYTHTHCASQYYQSSSSSPSSSAPSCAPRTYLAPCSSL